MPDTTGSQQDTRFKPGQSGNPAGRPKGSKHKLAEQFTDDLYALWKTEGAAILKEARDDKPMEFAKMVAGMVPRDVVLRHTLEDEMTDDELADTIAALAAVADRLRAGRASLGAIDESAGGKGRPQ